MSARRPGRSDPTWSAMPCVIAGSIVDLGEVAQDALGVVAIVRVVEPGSAGRPATPSAAALRRHAFMTWASWNVRRSVSPIRPIPCESELTIAIAPSSWSGPSAAIRASSTRSRTSATSPGTAHDSAVVEHRSSGRARRRVWTPNGSVGVVDEHRIDGSRTSPRRSGTWPPPVPSTW